MDLGTFSYSIAVKDMEKSLKFYKSLGFAVIDGGHAREGAFSDTETHQWRILRHASVIIGLFSGMFETNFITFNPKDARSIHKQVTELGCKTEFEQNIADSGPASFVLYDPDGNQILIDQHE